ncbi:MAG: CehA/McbA family metallohydrolase [Thermoleophilaceae bacterium]|nr:CehA/McbA family metallohydrolase [Thermoleophilaceae bacterium]
MACVIHVHSTHSDGTGTVAEIAQAAEAAGVDVVLLTDHDSLGARQCGEEGWHGGALVLVGEEVSPPDRNHYLAFGADGHVDHRGLTPAQVVEAVRERGGFGFAAHPFSQGSTRFRRLSNSMLWEDLAALEGIEVWSFLADNGQRVASIREALSFVARPERYVTRAPEHNLAEWDRLGASRQVVGIGGLDAHQFGRRIAGRAVCLMSYSRSFRQLQTRVLAAEPLTGDLEHDRDQVYSALRAGRCYIAAPQVAPPAGFAFFAERAAGQRLEMGGQAPAGGWTLHTLLPRPADVRLLCDGAEVARLRAPALVHVAQGPGVYRVEATLEAHGAERTWILSNPIYLR